MNSENTSTRKANGAFKWVFIILFILASMISSISYSYAAAVTKNNNDSETSADNRIQSFDVENDKIYFVDKKSGKLYTSDFSGNVNVVTNESVGEWVSN